MSSCLCKINYIAQCHINQQHVTDESVLQNCMGQYDESITGNSRQMNPIYPFSLRLSSHIYRMNFTSLSTFAIMFASHHYPYQHFTVLLHHSFCITACYGNITDIMHNTEDSLDSISVGGKVTRVEDN